MTASHRRWIVINAILVTAVINAVLNGLIAWATAAGRSRIPLWSTPLVGGPSTVTDTVGTLFILPLTTTLILTAVVRLELRRGRLEPLRCRGGLETLRLYLPPNSLARGAALGTLCLVCWLRWPSRSCWRRTSVTSPRARSSSTR